MLKLSGQNGEDPNTMINNVEKLQSLNSSNSNITINANIPIVDISKFDDVSTRKEFLASLEKGLKFGFFAYVDPKLDVQTIQEGYDAFNNFFKSEMKDKMTISRPDLRGQRGFIIQEKALGNELPDFKEYLHIGRDGNIWPKHMDLEGPATRLYDKLKELGDPILRGIALVLGQREDFFTDMTKNGENLMRALNYYPNPPQGIWAAEHTDIDLLTLLPYASEEGLEIEINGKWEQVIVPKNALVVNVGDQLEAFSNGYPSSKHRVRCTKENTGRQSIVFFIHPEDWTIIKPLGKNEPKYPEGNRLQYLFLRLFSNAQLTKEQSIEVMQDKFIRRIQDMVLSGKAADSVKKWFLGYLKSAEHFVRNMNSQ